MKIQDALNILGLEAGASQEAIKAAYKAACKKYHPDLNPAGLEMMKAVNAANDALENYDGSTPNGYAAETSYGDKLWAALQAIISLNVNIEICGAWVWVTGDTRAVKDTLKGAGYYFASKKQAWYYRPQEYRSSGRGKYDMNHIRNKYGSTVVKEKGEQKGLRG